MNPAPFTMAPHRKPGWTGKKVVSLPTLWWAFFPAGEKEVFFFGCDSLGEVFFCGQMVLQKKHAPLSPIRKIRLLSILK